MNSSTPTYHFLLLLRLLLLHSLCRPWSALHLGVDHSRCRFTSWSPPPSAGPETSLKSTVKFLSQHPLPLQGSGRALIGPRRCIRCLLIGWESRAIVREMDRWTSKDGKEVWLFILIFIMYLEYLGFIKLNWLYFSRENLYANFVLDFSGSSP